MTYLDPNSINGINLYAYCGSNPIKRIDPNGNAWRNWLVSDLQIAVGIALIAVGAVTMVMGGKEVVSGVTGTNYTRDWMGSGLYDGLYLGLNIATSVGTFAGNIGMRIASNNILNNLVKNPTKIPNYSLRQIKTYGKYTSQFAVGTLQEGNHIGQGYTLTHVKGMNSGYIQYHPGNSTYHTLKNPYFKITSNYVQGKTWHDIILKIFFKP